MQLSCSCISNREMCSLTANFAELLSNSSQEEGAATAKRVMTGSEKEILCSCCARSACCMLSRRMFLLDLVMSDFLCNRKVCMNHTAGSSRMQVRFEDMCTCLSKPLMVMNTKQSKTLRPRKCESHERICTDPLNAQQIAAHFPMEPLSSSHAGMPCVQLFANGS